MAESESASEGRQDSTATGRKNWRPRASGALTWIVWIIKNFARLANDAEDDAGCILLDGFQAYLQLLSMA